MFFAAIIVCLLVAGALLSSSPAAPEIPTTDIRIAAYPQSGFLVVASGDHRPLSRCKFTVNAGGLSTGYSLTVERIEPNGRRLLPLADFIASSGKRFDSRAYAVTTLLISCYTPEGRGYYGWERRR